MDKVIETDIVPNANPSDNRNRFKVLYKPTEISPGHYQFGDGSCYIKNKNGSFIRATKKKSKNSKKQRRSRKK